MYVMCLAHSGTALQANFFPLFFFFLLCLFFFAPAASPIVDYHLKEGKQVRDVPVKGELKEYNSSMTLVIKQKISFSEVDGNNDARRQV